MVQSFAAASSGPGASRAVCCQVNQGREALPGGLLLSLCLFLLDDTSKSGLSHSPGEVPLLLPQAVCTTDCLSLDTQISAAGLIRQGSMAPSAQAPLQPVAPQMIGMRSLHTEHGRQPLRPTTRPRQPTQYSMQHSKLLWLSCSAYRPATLRFMQTGEHIKTYIPNPPCPRPAQPHDLLQHSTSSMPAPNPVELLLCQAQRPQGQPPPDGARWAPTSLHQGQVSGLQVDMLEIACCWIF